MLKQIAASLALSTALVGMPVLADEEASNPLFGTWHVTSVTMQIAGEGAPREVYSPNPHGYLILTPEHRILYLIAAADRKPAKDDAGAAALLRSMLAYTGKFKLEPGKWTTTIDFSSSQANIGDPQVRYYSLDGDKLTVRTPEQNSLAGPGKHAVYVLTAEREK